MIGTNSSDKYRADIDGLRAIAVLSVFFFHLAPDLLPGGFLGVDVFFVISGYLITGIILRENIQGTFSFVHFYARRIKRIFPALFVVLVLSASVAVVLLAPDTYSNFMKSARYASAQLANFFFARNVGYFEEGFSDQPLLHTWSLGVEEQFYLFWPLMIYVVFRFFAQSNISQSTASVTIATAKTKIAAAFLLLSLLSYSACFYLAEVDNKQAFYMFYTRAWEFCVGGLVTLVAIRGTRNKLSQNLIGIIGLVLLVYSFVFVGQEYRGNSFLRLGVLLPCLGSALILYSTQQNSWINKLLATKIPVAIGKISYSLYLYHWPLIIYYKLYTDNHEISLVAATSIFVLAFMLSALSYFFVEQPARKGQVSDRRVIVYALLVIVIFMVGFKALEKQSLSSWRITAYPNGAVNPDDYGPYDCHTNIQNGIKIHECLTSGNPNAPQIALVGDSHTPHYFQSTLEWAKNRGFNVVAIAVPGCPMLLGEVRIKSELDRNHEPKCGRALPLFETRIAKEDRIQLVLLTQNFSLFFDGIDPQYKTRKLWFRDEKGNPILTHTDYYRKQLSYTIKELRAAGKEPIILKQVPLFGTFNSCEWEPLIKKVFSIARECSYDDNFIDKWQKPSIEFIDQFASDHQLKVYDPFLYLDVPLQGVSNIYQNRDHLNTYGFFHMIPDFVEKMDDLTKSMQLR